VGLVREHRPEPATGPQIEMLAVEAASRAESPARELPSTNSLLADILAEHHATWEVRLFAS
jgi:urease accessory protein